MDFKKYLILPLFVIFAACSVPSGNQGAPFLTGDATDANVIQEDIEFGYVVRPVEECRLAAYTEVFPSRVVDGDTFDGSLELGFGIRLENQRFRLWNYNAPEKTGPEKPHGLIAKAQLEKILSTKPKWFILNRKKDAFGRWLVDVMIGHSTVSQYLVSRGYGVAWDGKGKRPGFDPSAPYPLPGATPEQVWYDPLDVKTAWDTDTFSFSVSPLPALDLGE